MKNTMIILISLFLLSGCATTTTTQKKVDLIVEDKLHNKVVFPSGNDSLPCDDFPLFKGKTFGDLYDFVTIEVFQSYQVCTDKLKVNQDFINNLK